MPKPSDLPPDEGRRPPGKNNASLPPVAEQSVPATDVPPDAAPKLEVVRYSLDELHQDPANARAHNERNLQVIADSLKAFAQVEPLVVQRSTGKVIGGNGRLEAMRALGWTECDVALVDMDDTQATALGIALNRTAELASWDYETLERLTASLKDSDFDLDTIGFNEADLTALARQSEAQIGDDDYERDLDEAPEVPVDATTRPGDIWELGEHRLICGDSTILDDMQRLCAGTLVDAVVTDPPYGVNVVGGNRMLSVKDRLKQGGKTIQNDGLEDLKELLLASLGNAYTCSKEGAPWYVWAPAGPQLLSFATVLTDLKVWRQTIVWIKDSFVLGHSDYHYRHEVCFYGWREGKHMGTPDRKQDTVWEEDRPKRSADHPTMKPLALIERCLRNSTTKGQVVLEPFCGSGTTLIACETLGRRCLAVELSPNYCDVIVKRWTALTGREARLADRDSDKKETSDV